ASKKKLLDKEGASPRSCKAGVRRRTATTTVAATSTVTAAARASHACGSDYQQNSHGNSSPMTLECSQDIPAHGFGTGDGRTRLLIARAAAYAATPSLVRRHIRPAIRSGRLHATSVDLRAGRRRRRPRDAHRMRKVSE